MANETRRIIVKKGTSVPTIPSSTDHTDGTWLATDIYKGEFYLNTTTGKLYTRNDSGISEVGTTSGFIPYTGATNDVDLGEFKLNAQSIHAKGTGGLGHVGLKHQSANATASTSETSIFADSNGDIKYKNDGNYYTTLKTSLNTADRVYTFPDSTGTLALTTDIPFNSLVPRLTGHESFRGVEYANNSTTETTFGGITIATTASAAARSVATTNFATRQIRKGFTASVVSSGRYTGTRGSALLWYVTGGFKYVCDFYISDTAYASGCRQFYGMMGQTTDLTYSDVTLVDTMVNIIGVGSDSADTNLQIFHNDATGTATKIDLGANFPANRSAGAALTTMYSVTIYNDNNSSDVLYQVTNNETGDSVEGTISTNLPLSTQGLNFVASRCMGGGGGLTNSGQFDLGKLGVYSL